MPHNVRIRLNVGGTVFHTSLHTLMEGARRGCDVFQCLCSQILNLGRVCSTQSSVCHTADRASVLVWSPERMLHCTKIPPNEEHFVDADPTPFPYWLDYFRTGRVPMVDAAVRDKVVLESELVGLAELADALRAQEDTELGRVKKELTEMREEVREMREKVAAILEYVKPVSEMYLIRFMEEERKRMEEERKRMEKEAEFERSIESLASPKNIVAIFGGMQTNIAAIVGGMKLRATDAGIQDKACEAVLELTPCVEAEEWRKVQDEKGDAYDSVMAKYAEFAKLGVIEHLVQVLSLHMQSTSAVISTCKIIRCISRNADNRVRIAKEGGIPKILAALATHADKVKVVENACWALSYLAKDNKENQIAIQQARGSALVSAAVAADSASAATKKYGKMVLDELKLPSEKKGAGCCAVC